MDLILVIALSLVFNALAYLFLRRQIVKKLASKSYLSELEDEVNRIVTELNGSTERNVQIIEHKISELKKLTARVDGTMAILTRELETRQKANDRYQELSKKKPVIQTQMELLNQGTGSSESRSLQTESSETVISKTKKESLEITGAQSMSSKKKRILALYKEGKDALEISNETRIPLGEIELVLSLADK